MEYVLIRTLNVFNKDVNVVVAAATAGLNKEVSNNVAIKIIKKKRRHQNLRRDKNFHNFQR